MSNPDKLRLPYKNRTCQR